MHRDRAFRHPCSRDATVKHMIEVLGVPHTEVELICVNGEPMDFSGRLADGDRVSIYPAFAVLDVSAIAMLRPPLTTPGRFIADAHLGQLAKHLRMLGFDVLYRNDYSDAELAKIAAQDDRIVLTRDRDLLIRKEVVRGCYLHSLTWDAQAAEVIGRFKLHRHVNAFSRCLSCNGELRAVEKCAVEHRVPQHSRQFYERFYQCMGCAQVYWEGSHVARMRGRVAQMLRGAGA